MIKCGRWFSPKKENITRRDIQARVFVKAVYIRKSYSMDHDGPATFNEALTKLIMEPVRFHRILVKSEHSFPRPSPGKTITEELNQIFGPRNVYHNFNTREWKIRIETRVWLPNPQEVGHGPDKIKNNKTLESRDVTYSFSF